MAFSCPECASPASLVITSGLELAPDANWDEISVQILRCANCGFCGVALYQESRRGAFGDSLVVHQGYAVALQNFRILEQAIAACPSPGDHHCECRSHALIEQVYASGAWRGADTDQEGNGFVMQTSS
jgi:hypothetical protein